MKLNSRVSISSGVRFCCCNLSLPETGSNSEYSCCIENTEQTINHQCPLEQSNRSKRTKTNRRLAMRSSNWRRYQARMVYSTFLHSFRNSFRSASCSACSFRTRIVNQRGIMDTKNTVCTNPFWLLQRKPPWDSSRRLSMTGSRADGQIEESLLLDPEPTKIDR